MVVTICSLYSSPPVIHNAVFLFLPLKVSDMTKLERHTEWWEEPVNRAACSTELLSLWLWILKSSLFLFDSFWLFGTIFILQDCSCLCQNKETTRKNPIPKKMTGIDPTHISEGNPWKLPEIGGRYGWPPFGPAFALFAHSLVVTMFTSYLFFLCKISIR